MKSVSVGPPSNGNHLLRALSIADQDLLAPHMELLPLVKDQMIFQPAEPATHVWFPIEGMVSIVVGEDDGAAIEVATVGREGMTGVPVVLGGETMIYTAMVQVPGAGWRIEAVAFRRIVASSPTLQTAMLRYVLATITQIGQNAACAHRHGLEARCARWLLLAHDDVDGDSFSLTQDYLAMMLGVTRPSVSNTASALQRAGLIRYVRGQMTIIDRPGLEGAACDCYAIVKTEFERLLPV
jgi:CRP-like cAMP-binding protein